MIKIKFHYHCLWAPASLLALLMGCATPVTSAEDLGLSDAASEEGADLGDMGDTDEDVSEASDAILGCGAAGCTAGVGWSNWSPISGIEAYSVPSVAHLGGVPYMAYVGAGNQCYLSSYVNAGWATPAVIPGCVGPASPSLAVYNNALYAGYLGAGRGCFLNSYTGLGWGRGFGIAGCGGAFAPVIAPYGGSLAAVYGGVAGGVYHATCGLGGFYGGLGCGAGALIPGIATPYAPALGVYGNQLTLAYTNLNRQVYYSNFGGCAGCGWGTPIGIAGAYANWGPTLGYGANALYLGYGGGLGGFGWAGYTGRGWGAYNRLVNPFFGYGAGLGLGYFGRGFGAFAPHRGRLYWSRFGW